MIHDAINADAEWITHEINFDRDPQIQLRREWLLTNGTGTYAMGTAIGVNTRRYHGLLVAAARQPVGRIMALNQMLEQWWPADGAGQTPIEFSSGLFRDSEGKEVFAPQGHAYLESFKRGLSVQWQYRHKDFRFTRELFLHWHEHAATIRYRLQTVPGGFGGRLRLSPMLTLRDFHAVRGKEESGAFAVEADSQLLIVRRGEVSVTMASESGRFVEDPKWWYGQHYPVETGRGQEDTEDLFVPGGFEWDLPDGFEQEILLSVQFGSEPASPQCDMSKRRNRLTPHLRCLWTGPTDGDEELWSSIAFSAEKAASVKRALVLAADDFIAERQIGGETLSTVLAGYPWFADWGRDTFVSLGGLLLATGRFDEARATLRVFAGAIRNGLIPNRFDDYDDSVTAAHYNTVDASLWFINAALQYRHATGDLAVWDEWLCAACNRIIDAYLKGTDHGIRAAGDGLITAGSPKTQLTWMDAACDGQVLTARPGKAVEINALWHNALMGMSELLAESDTKTATHYRKLAKRIKRSFIKVFWDDELGHLRDYVWVAGCGAEHVDRSLRPNQILVASLAHSPLPRTKQQLVVEMVKAKLLTPFGLRTLPVDHPDYHPHYAGPQSQRDAAYHQGTIWPWLIGPYAEAVLRVGRFSQPARQEALRAMLPLLEMVLGRGPYGSVGQLHEIHEAESPHRPVGCMAQAWSVAEVLRVVRLIERGTSDCPSGS